MHPSLFTVLFAVTASFW